MTFGVARTPYHFRISHLSIQGRVVNPGGPHPIWLLGRVQLVDWGHDNLFAHGPIRLGNYRVPKQHLQN